MAQEGGNNGKRSLWALPRAGSAVTGPAGLCSLCPLWGWHGHYTHEIKSAFAMAPVKIQPREICAAVPTSVPRVGLLLVNSFPLNIFLFIPQLDSL